MQEKKCWSNEAEDDPTRFILYTENYHRRAVIRKANTFFLYA